MLRFPQDLIIFDCDGVLIDSERLSHQAMVDVLKECNIHLSLRDAMLNYVGVGIERSFLPIIRTESACVKGGLFKEKLKPITGVFDALNLLDRYKISKCVASSASPERLRYTLTLAGLWERLFPHVFSVSQVKRSKPAPDLFLFAARQMNVPPSHCLVIEDSIAGVQAAKEAHMRVLGFAGGSHCLEGHAQRLVHVGAERVFDNMASLFDYIAAEHVAIPSREKKIAVEPRI